MLEQFHLCPLVLPKHQIRFSWSDSPPPSICQLRIFHAKVLVFSLSDIKTAPAPPISACSRWTLKGTRLTGEVRRSRWAQRLQEHTFCLLRGQAAAAPIKSLYQRSICPASRWLFIRKYIPLSLPAWVHRPVKRSLLRSVGPRGPQEEWEGHGQP